MNLQPNDFSVTLDDNESLCSDAAHASVALPTWKRVTDIVLVILAFPAFGLIAAFMWFLIRFSSPGSLFFKQERVGFKGKTFLCYKFRTMKMNADTGAHQAHIVQAMREGKPMLKLDGKKDNRLILGAWAIRAFGLDELPQIINVLKGEMSLVGPRPCVPYEAAEYLPWQRERFNATPGLTGLWQVSGKNRLTFDKMIRLDIRYTQEKSFLMDVRIICSTIPAMVVQFLDTKKSRKSAK